MNAPTVCTATATPIDIDSDLEPRLIDFSECPTTGWPAEVALQAHIRITQLQRENRALRAERLPFCDTCGSRPCRNPSFCDACRRADRNRKRSWRR
jgi:hypothetical protein